METSAIITQLQHLYAQETLLRIQQAKTAKLEQEYKAAKDFLMSAMQAAGVHTITDASSMWRAEIRAKPVYNGESWPMVYEYIRNNDAFALLHKRLRIETCNEYYHLHGTPPPGVARVVLQELKLGSED